MRYAEGPSSMPSIPTSGGSYAPSLPNPLSSKTMPDIWPWPGNQNNSIRDTREFLKVSYSAQIRTRDVPEAVKDVKSAVRDAEGRLDSYSSSEKYGYVSFVVPKSKFDAFKDEVEGIAHRKLVTTSESSTNLLGQKQNIEERTASATSTLASYQSQKQALDAQHARTLANLKAEQQQIDAELAAIRSAKAVSSDSTTIESLRDQETVLLQQKASVESRRYSENQSYNQKNGSVTQQIQWAQSNVDNMAKEDSAFADNIETVNGYVTVRWISLWDLTAVFSPIHPTWIVLILIVAAVWYAGRRKWIPLIEWA